MCDYLMVEFADTVMHVPRNMLVEDFEHETHLKGLSLHDVRKSDPCEVPQVRCLKMRAHRISDDFKKCISPYQISSMKRRHCKRQIMGFM